MEPSLRKLIESAINRVSAENGSDTPDFILVEYLVGCLAAYDKAVTSREKWYGRECAEARNKMTDALQEVDLRTLDFERMKQELHAARAEAAKWEAIAFWEANANSSTKKELHSADPMWQKPLSTSNPIPNTTSP